MWKTLEEQILVVATVEWAVWGRASSFWSKTRVLRRPRPLDLDAGDSWFPAGGSGCRFP
jgi:hypothetical protein